MSKRWTENGIRESARPCSFPVGLWVWRNQNVTETLGFYSGFKRNVWHQRWAKGGLKMVFVSRPSHAVSLFWGFFFKVSEVFHVHNFHKPAKTSTIASKPYNFLVHSNGFFDDERRNQLFHGTWAAKYWNHVKTVGLWAWRNQNVTKTLGFYGGFKRNVWHRRSAKGGLKMVFVSRPGHAVSPFWSFFFFKVPEVFHVHNFHKSAKTFYNFLVHSNGFFDDERRNQLFHGTWAAKYWNHVKTVTKTWPKR